MLASHSDRARSSRGAFPIETSCRGVGLGFRAELAAPLIGGRLATDFLEMVAESCHSRALEREAAALGRRWPLALHGVKVSLGSADGLDEGRARRLARLSRRLGASMVSEHVAFTRAGGIEIGHLTALPYTEAAVAVVARNARRLQAMLDVPLLLENVAWTVRWPEDALDEAAFITRVVEASGCDLLLDVGNLYANARNGGLDPLTLLDALPLGRVRMLHVAGGVVTHGFYYDTHAHPIPDAVFALVEGVLARTGPLPVLLERDADLDDVPALAAEIARLRAVARKGRPCASGGAASRAPLALRRVSLDARAGEAALEVRQAHLARLLTSASPLSPVTAEGFDVDALLRSRAVLLRKRVDDALPLLPELGRRRDTVAPIAMAALSDRPRARRFQAFTDAVVIAESACADTALAAMAARDALALRARFVRQSDGGARPRRGPFLGRLRDGEGELWVTKGFGAEAGVHVWRRR